MNALQAIDNRIIEIIKSEAVYNIQGEREDLIEIKELSKAYERIAKYHSYTPASTPISTWRPSINEVTTAPTPYTYTSATNQITTNQTHDKSNR